MKSPAKLYLRVRLPDGSYPYLKAAYASNGRLRPHHAVHNGKVLPFPGSAYYLRYNHSANVSGSRLVMTHRLPLLHCNGRRLNFRPVFWA